MGRRTDTRQRIIGSSLTAMREHGYASTAISDIVAASGAPRGSVTFHFPGGKDEIAREVVELRTTQVVAGVAQAAADSGTADEFVARCFDRVTEDLARSGFLAGCPVVPIAIDRTPASEDLARVCRSFFAAWRNAIERHLSAFDVAPDRAAAVAALAVYATEGALVVSRLEQDPSALTTARDQVRRLLPAAVPSTEAGATA